MNQPLGDAMDAVVAEYALPGMSADAQWVSPKASSKAVRESAAHAGHADHDGHDHGEETARSDG